MLQMAERWTPDTWRNKPIQQVPDYPDRAALGDVEKQLAFGRSPHNGPLLIGPRALAKALNQKGGRGRPSLLRLELALFSPRPESSARLFRRRGNDRMQDAQ
jgi:hypothetical protein